MLIISVFFLGGTLVVAQENSGTIGSDTKLPIPRFVSLKADEVNLRRGPGGDYRIDWIYKRENLPVMVIGEHNHWRRVRDSSGAEGWVHRALLQNDRMAEIIGGEVIMLHKPEIGARPIARVEAGSILELKKCAERWCKVKSGRLKGWIKSPSIWGVLSGEVF